MTIRPHGTRTTRLAHERAALPVLIYVAQHQAALWHAARLIGGYKQARLVDRLADALQRERHLTRRVPFMLEQLLDLLALEPVGDEDGAVLGHFVPLDPAIRVVEICLLTDGLRIALEEAAVLAARADAPTTAAQVA